MHVNLGTLSIGTADGQAGRKETSRLYSKENLVPSPTAARPRESKERASLPSLAARPPGFPLGTGSESGGRGAQSLRVPLWCRVLRGLGLRPIRSEPLTQGGLDQKLWPRPEQV